MFPSKKIIGSNKEDGLWVVELGVTTNIIPNTAKVGESELHQNYPNPFNPLTKIKFVIPSDLKRQKSDVRLIVYDASGKEIETLVDEKLSSGSYEAEFDGEDYSSGIYFYKLKIENFFETKRMILLK